MKEIELHNASVSARNYFESICNVEDLKKFHRAVCNNFNIDRIFSIEDVMYLLYEFDEIALYAIKNFPDNDSVIAAINYNNAEKEYYKFINEKYK